MTNHEIQSRLARLVRTERKITNEILKLVRLADERRLHLELGFSSLFDWMTRGLGYSESAAQRRISSARLAGAVPAALEKIETGAVNLTTLAKAQTVIRAQEKATGRTLSREEKSRAVLEIENKTALEAERVLVDLFPEAAAEAKPESRTELAGDRVQLSLTLSRAAIEDLERIRALLSHALPAGAKLTDVVAYLAKDFRKRRDPLLKPAAAGAEPAETSVAASVETTAATAKRRVSGGTTIPAALRLAVMKRDGGRCTFEDPQTKRQCGSTHHLQLDHVYPKALGGEDSLDNLRCLCGAHNRHTARLVLGEAHAGFRRRP